MSLRLYQYTLIIARRTNMKKGCQHMIINSFDRELEEVPICQGFQGRRAMSIVEGKAVTPQWRWAAESPLGQPTGNSYRNSAGRDVLPRSLSPYANAKFVSLLEFFHFFYWDISTTPIMTRWSSVFFFFLRWWSTELVTWTGRATCCRTDRASACSARTAIYKLQVAKFASPWQVLLSSSLRQYHSDSSTFKLHGARYEVQKGSRHTFWNWGSTRKEGKKPNGRGRCWDVSFTESSPLQ